MTIYLARALRLLRSLAAGVLLAAFFLPLARCEGAQPPAPGATASAVESMVPAKLVDREEPATLLIAAIFIWPLLLLALYAARPALLRFSFLEPLPAAATLWYLWQITVEWGEVLWAGYAALAATALYAAAALLVAPTAWRAWLESRARR